MVMKDKLVKNHHKGAYYTVRKVIIGMLCGFTFAAAIAVPTYISSTIKKNDTAGLAEEDTRSSQEENQQESESSEYEEYNHQ